MDIAASKICVIGGGIGGLAVANAFARRGASVTVLEQSEAIKEVGAGLQISPNGMRVLEALGLADNLRNCSIKADAVSLRDYREGSVVVRLDLTQLPEGQDYQFVHRADLVEVLAAGARDAGVNIRLLQQVVDIDMEAGVVTTSSGDSVQADLIVGADGLHSVLREKILGKRAPFFTGQVAWRAVIPNDLHFPAEARVYMGLGKHLVCYPLRDGSLLNLVAVQERSEWAAEGWHFKDDPKNLEEAFAEFGPEVHALFERVEDVGLWGLYRHKVAPKWFKGKTALLGDAAHPTLPFMAQGANMALEDAWVLADTFETEATLPKALQAYQKKRRSRCEKIVETASGNAWKYHLSSLPLRWVAHLGMKIIGDLAPGRLLHQFDWIYGHDVTKRP